jgi:heptose I phosphotransferase
MTTAFIHEIPLAAVLLVLAVVAAGCWLLAGRSARRSRLGQRGFVNFHAAHRAWLRELRLCEPEDFLRLEALIVSGHPGREVGRLTLGTGSAARVVYLKREQTSSWLTRLGNFVAGFGWVARPVREAQMLEALQRDGLPGPRWLATGEDASGASFLLVEEVPDTTGLTRALEGLEGDKRRQVAVRLGRLLACLHEAGFFHRDLYAKHVLVDPGGAVHLLDWQRARRGAWITRAARIRDLAALHATLPDHLAGPRDRLALLRAYAGPERANLRWLAREVQKEARRLLRHRHIREKRQPPPAGAQAWICLDGQALAITPVLADLYQGTAPDWLPLDHQPLPPRGEESRQGMALPGNRKALLVRRRGWPGLACLIRAWLGGRPIISAHQRRATLLWRLQRHGVMSARVLAVGQRRPVWWCVDSFLLIEPLPSTIPLVEYLAGQPSNRAALIERVGLLLARLHEGCCYLGDAGIAQLAVQSEGDAARPVLADAEGVAGLRKPCARRARADLAGLRRLLGAADMPDLQRGYRGLQSSAAEVKTWATSPAAERRTVPATASLWQRLLHGWRRLIARPDWEELAGSDWAERIMEVAVTDRFSAKQGRSTGRWVLEADPARFSEPRLNEESRRLVVYLKRHYHLPWWRGVLAVLWPGGDWSPAMQEYNHLQWAQKQGVPVPATAAVGERIGPGWGLSSFLAVEELTGMLPLNEAIPLVQDRLSPGDFHRWKRTLVAELARLARLLHDRHHFHKDLYLCHFFIHQDDMTHVPEPGGWRGRVFLIDLHRLGHHPWTWWLWLWKDLAQMLYSSGLPGVGVRDQIAFWKHYRGPGNQRWSWRWLRWAVLFKWRRYCRHNQKKRRRKAEG